MKKVKLDFDNKKPIDIAYTIFNGNSATVSLETDQKEICEIKFEIVDLFLVENESLFFSNNKHFPTINDSILWEGKIENEINISPHIKKYILLAGDYCITVYASNFKEFI